MPISIRELEQKLSKQERADAKSKHSSMVARLQAGAALRVPQHPLLGTEQKTLQATRELVRAVVELSDRMDENERKMRRLTILSLAQGLIIIGLTLAFAL